MQHGELPPISRRDWMRLSSAGLLGASVSGWFAELARAAERQRCKSCILLWMNGGPSQVHTFDLKEGAEFRPIATAVCGIEISEHLPKLAQLTKHMTLCRSMCTPENDHVRARFHMQYGYRMLGGTAYPALGSIVSAECGQAGFELPNYVAISGGSFDGPSGHARPTAGYLGPQHAPYLVDNPARVMERLQSRGGGDLAGRVALLDEAEKSFRAQYDLEAVAAHQSVYQQALRLLHSNKAQAFSLDKEPQGTRAAYGENQFGQACLLARRLVEVGVPFVEVTLGGWDDHDSKNGAAPHVKRRSPYLDQSMSALLADLKERGLLDSTLVVWMGEFGRNPHPYRSGIRGGGHYSKAWTTIFAGGGLKMGQVVGKTDPTGQEVVERPISAPDFLATICQALGIDFSKRYETRDNRPIRIVDKGATPVEALF